MAVVWQGAGPGAGPGLGSGARSDGPAEGSNVRTAVVRVPPEPY